MEKQVNLLARLKLPTRIIVNRSELTPAALDQIVRAGELAPAGGDTCELEAGGQVLARGKIVRRRGRFYFKVLATAEEEKE